MLTDIKTELHSDIQYLTTRLYKLEALPHSASASNSATPQDILSQAPAFDNPEITAVPSYLEISDLDLANNNILWTRVTSAGIPLSLSLDSCCSLSLVRQAHAEVISHTHPTMQFTKFNDHPSASFSGKSSCSASGYKYFASPHYLGKW